MKNILVFLFLIINIQTVFADTLLSRLNKPVLAPEFSLTDLNEDTHKLSDFKGKTVIINFWATWCPPCREELPSMNRAWKKLKNDDIIMLAINVGEDEDTVFSFLGDYPIDFTTLFDKSGEVTQQWPIKGLPTTFIVDPDGYVIYRAIGGREWDNKKLLDTIRALKNK